MWNIYWKEAAAIANYIWRPPWRRWRHSLAALQLMGSNEVTEKKIGDNEERTRYWQERQMNGTFGYIHVVKSVLEKCREDDRVGDNFIWKPPWSFWWSICD